MIFYDWEGAVTLQHLRIFLAVCGEGGVTAAAKKLYLSQPAVSIALKELERNYGVKLFERGGRRLRITPAGERMFGEALGIVSGLEDMENALRNWETAGKMRVGSSITIGTELLPGLVLALRRQFPELSVYVQVSSSEVIERRLLDNGLDLALIEGEVHSDALAFKTFLSDELGVYCHEADPLCEKNAAGIGDIAAAPLLLREPGSAAREMVDALLKVNGLTAAPVWESTSTHALLNATSCGLGVAILPARLADRFVGHGGLARLCTEGFSLRRDFKLIYPKKRRLTRAQTALIELCGALEGGGPDGE